MAIGHTAAREAQKGAPSAHLARLRMQGLLDLLGFRAIFYGNKCYQDCHKSYEVCRSIKSIGIISSGLVVGNK